jgi:hypothetical protein
MTRILNDRVMLAVKLKGGSDSNWHVWSKILKAKLNSCALTDPETKVVSSLWDNTNDRPVDHSEVFDFIISNIDPSLLDDAIA